MSGKIVLMYLVFTLGLSVIRANALEIGQKCPELAASNQDNPTATVSNYQGKIVLIDFWASWCTSCEKTLPWLTELQNQYGNKGLQVITINLDTNKKDANEILDSTKNSFVVAYDPEGQIASAYNVEAMPTSVLLDKEGKVVEIFNRGLNEKEKKLIEKRIRSLLNS